VKIIRAEALNTKFNCRFMKKLSQLRIEVSEPAANLLSDYLLGFGSLGVAVDIQPDDKFEISAYFPMDADLAQIIKNIKEYSSFIQENVQDCKVGEITAQHIDRSSWEAWRRVLKKVRAGNRIIIKPPWEDHIPVDNEIVIEINPSLAFGTGHHETTRLCIEAMEDILKTNDVTNILDVGCGSGILSIAAAKLGANNITGFDTDPIAVKESIKNAHVNGTSDGISFFCGYIQSVKGVFDLIVANVYMEPIYLMREEFKARLAENGVLVISGIPRNRRDEAVNGITKAGFELYKERGGGDWFCFEFMAE